MEAGAFLSLHNEYNMLSLPDLLLAREKNHVELMRKAHVVGTAVGLYLIRKKDPWPKGNERLVRKSHPPRTLGNSEVRDYSWPAILVFVDQWKEPHDIGWRDMIPEAIYLDENRKVPVCVVYAPREEVIDTQVRNVVFPSSRIGGGYPVIAKVQGEEHIASIGCLARDGHTVYALTNRHVTGEANEPVYGRFGGVDMRIGVSAKQQLTRKPFSAVYSNWAGKNTFLNMDVGLIRVDDLNRWTAQIYGIGTAGPMADLGIDNLTLRIIDCPVRAYGCASGQLRGSIKALFYRYKSAGGFEYVSDFLIGARSENEAFSTHPGDSGTVWLLEAGDLGLMPIAIQWGGQVFSEGWGKTQLTCALATCLSTVCNLLNIDLIRDWNTGVTAYWGEVGHYTIGALACTVAYTGLPGLQQLMSKNIDRVGFVPADLKRTDKVLKNQAHYSFVPLADVPDDVWRFTRASNGDTNNDGNNHFADMDQPAKSGKYKGKTLLELCQDPANIDPQIWQDFYAGVPGTNPGTLPFRVWQGYQEMVKFVKRGDAVSFLCAAGCIAHYVGDACQPLHISRLHHGDPDHQTSVSKKVHSVYETGMLNDHAPEIVDGVVAYLNGKKVKASFTGGHGAAERVVRLMRETVAALPPQSIVDAYNGEITPQARLDRLWKDFGDLTIARMGEGCICMAEIWASAWAEGGGETTVKKSDLVGAAQQALSDLYKQTGFLPSMTLPLMIPLLNGAPAPPPGPATKKTAGGKKAAKKVAAKKTTKKVAVPV